MKKHDKLSPVRSTAGGLYGWTIKKNLGLTAVFTFVMFLAMPLVNLLSIIAKISQKKTVYFVSQHMDEVFNITGVLIAIVSAIMCVVLACILFNHLHNKIASDTVHSLPMSRTGLFLKKYFAGITLINVPVIIVVLLTLGTYILTYHIENYVMDNYIIRYILGYLCMILLSQTAFFTLAVFTAINSGKIFDTIISLLGINAVWPLIFVSYLATNSMFSFFAQKYVEVKFPFWLYSLFSPLLSMLCSIGNIFNQSFDLVRAIWWPLFIILMVLASIYTYNRRKNELNGMAYVSTPVKCFLQVSIPFVAGCILGFVFPFLLDFTPTYVIFMLLFSFEAYIILEVILYRGFSHFLKGLNLYAVVVSLYAVMLLIFLIVYLAKFGFSGFSSTYQYIIKQIN